MNIVRPVRQEDIAGVTVAKTQADLKSFLQPASAATVWPRRIPTSVLSWLAELDPDALPHGRVVVPTSAVKTTLGHLFDMVDLPRGAPRDWLFEDIAGLADVFATMMDAAFLRLRLDVVTTNACRKFHMDAISARLVCTYRGTGTQYGTALNGKDPAQIATVATGAPILLRGTRWPEHPASGLKHRSPPIEGTGETRLVLVLDPISDLENDL